MIFASQPVRLCHPAAVGLRIDSHPPRLYWQLLACMSCGPLQTAHCIVYLRVQVTAHSQHIPNIIMARTGALALCLLALVACASAVHLPKPQTPMTQNDNPFYSETVLRHTDCPSMPCDAVTGLALTNVSACNTLLSTLPPSAFKRWFATTTTNISLAGSSISHGSVHTLFLSQYTDYSRSSPQVRNRS